MCCLDFIGRIELAVQIENLTKRDVEELFIVAIKETSGCTVADLVGGLNSVYAGVFATAE